MSDYRVIDPDTGLPAHENDYYLQSLDSPPPSQDNNIIDDFEDNDLSEYQADPDNGTWRIERSNAMGGEYILKGRGADTGYNAWVVSDNSLPNLPARGDRFRFDWEAVSGIPSNDNSKFFIQFGGQDGPTGTHNAYELEIEVATPEVDMQVDNGGTDTSLGDATIPLDNYTPYRTTIGWDTDGSGTFDISFMNRDTGNVVGSFTSSADTSFNGGNIAFYCRHELNVRIDNIINLSV